MKKLICRLAIIACTFSVFLLNSCESFIDLKPRDRISTNDYWKTSSDLKNYMLQFYNVFFSGNFMVQDATNSDDMITASASTILDGKRSPSTGGWSSDWVQIRNLNIFFNNYQKCKDGFSQYKHYLGEAHFLRAWYYFELVKKYGDVPYYSKPIDVADDETLMRPRDSRTLVVDSILNDLDHAVSYLNSRNVVGNSTINKEVALAFKTRVALYEGTWQKYHANTSFGTANANTNKYFQECVTAAEELMNGNYKVGIYNKGNPDIDYFNLFGFENMSNIDEVLLYRAFNAKDGLGNPVQGYMTYNNDSRGVTWELVSSYLNKEGKPYDYLKVSETYKGNIFLSKIAKDCDPRLKSTIWIPGDLMAKVVDSYFTKPEIDGAALQLCQTGFRPKKTANPFAASAGQSWEVTGETGYIMFRYGEVLLNYAEAKCELDNTVAYPQLNLLRERVGMPKFVVNTQSSDPNLVDYGYPISDELYEIRRERRVELALETLRDEDLMRWAAHSLFKGKRPKGYPLNREEFPKYNNSIDNNGLLDYFAKAIPNGYKFREGQDYLYSIPQNELILNPKLTQNPGW